MHHLYPLNKGDPLCPLGFYPQVRWPSRCKRCFRDYKEHGGKKRDESSLRREASTASTPSLSWNSNDTESNERRGWTSNRNSLGEKYSNRSSNSSSSSDSGYSNPSSWTSTPDLSNLQEDTQAVTVSIKLPSRKPKPVDTGQRTVSDSNTVIKENRTPLFNKSDSLETRAKKLQALKESRASEKEVKRIQVKEVKKLTEEPNNHDVHFLIQVKRKPTTGNHTDESGSGSENDDTISIAGTETTDTTLVGVDHELQEQLENLRKELEITKLKCDKLEREKSDILLRRLAAMETTTSKTTASEVLKLQQKCNDLQQQLEDYRDEKRSLTLKVRELEADLELRPTAQEAQKIADELRSKLLAAETLCEELMDENEDMKKELKDMEEQMDELQDNFREDQAVEYTSIKKELDQTTKNCRILSFKLRKAERRAEQLENEKSEIEKKLKDISGGPTSIVQIDKINRLEQELKVANEVSLRLQKELDETNKKMEEMKTPGSRKKVSQLSNIGQTTSSERKISRESLTRGGSQDDSTQLLRDLQDSLEREADLREQLKFAEEEAQTLRNKVSRIEDDNESLVLQLKKMATKSRSRKLSPTNQRLTPEPLDKSDILDEEDPAELKLQLELSEQEASVLRKKVEELEADNHTLKTKTKILQEKATKSATAKSVIGKESTDNSLDSQKLKVFEEENNELRKKLIEKERDCERLHAELTLTQKKTKSIQKTKSLDLDQQRFDMKRQLQVIEQEASILRNKVQSLETENEKLVTENKKLNLLKNTKMSKSEKNIDKYIDQIATLEVELECANKTIEELKTKQADAMDITANQKGDYNKFSQRTAKKITSLTSKEQLKGMVSDLEKEISQMLLAMKSYENQNIKLEEEVKKLRQNSEIEKTLKELEDLNKQYDTVKKELENEKSKMVKENQKEELASQLNKTKENLEKANVDKKKLKEQADKFKKDITTLKTEKKELTDQVENLRMELKNSFSKQDEMAVLMQNIENLKVSVQEKDKRIKEIEKEIQEKNEQNSKYLESSKKVKELEERLVKYEAKYNDYDKKMKEKCKDYDEKVEKEKQKVKALESNCAKMEENSKKLNLQIENLNTKIAGLENTIDQKNKLLHQLEDSLKQERELLSKTNSQVEELESRKICSLKDSISKKQALISEMESKLETSNKNEKSLEEKIKQSELNYKNSKLNLEKKNKELEVDLQNERKKIEAIKTSNEKEQKNKELEISTLRNKIRKLELSTSSSTGRGNELVQETIKKLEETIERERQKYDDLTAKYEILEEEHVVTKAKLITEKETLETQCKNLRNDMDQLEKELRTVRDTYNNKQDVWIKEKLEIEQKLKGVLSNNGNDFEKQRLKALYEEKQSEYDQLKKKYDEIRDQVEYMRRDSDELKKKLDDYEKLHKIQRNISADSSAMDKEIKQLKLRLNNADKQRKSDLAECKIRYESQLNIVNAELQSLQNQVLRFKREKDTYKHMLESAQKTIGELKQSPKVTKDGVGPKLAHYDEVEESKTKITTLEQQISCMEDELSEARLESSRLKTELISERSTWEVKIAELHSKINELEEEKVLISGRTKIVGLRTKMELAWQKEREEQQRLLQETATLARDLRQTLFEVERERDKERLEAKRKQDQVKKTLEEEQDESKRKMAELQCDLLELRDAHAKLRTTNEKLRREKERYEKGREELRSLKSDRRRSEQVDDKNIGVIIEQIDSLKQLAPELFFSKENEGPYTPTPPRRTKSKSRETSPAVGKEESSLSPSDKQQYIQYIMQRIVHASEDLRKIQRTVEDDVERERIRRNLGMRRATSTETENGTNSRALKQKSFPSQRTNLHRKSISLEHDIRGDQRIWKTDTDSMSSLQSIEQSSDIEINRSMRETSLDSRLSGGSTQSDVGDKKKKKSFMGTLRKLTKSRSIDDTDPGAFSPSRPLSSKHNSGSDIEEKGSKRDLKERITDIFRRAGSSSRSNSVERKHETSSLQRPLVKTGSNGNIK